MCRGSQDVPEGGASELGLSHIQMSVSRIRTFLQQEDTQCTSCAENTYVSHVIMGARRNFSRGGQNRVDWQKDLCAEGANENFRDFFGVSG